MSNKRKKLPEINNDNQEPSRKKQKFIETNNNQEIKSNEHNNNNISETKEEKTNDNKQINVVINGTSELFKVDTLKSIPSVFLSQKIEQMLETNADQPLEMDGMRFQMSDFKQGLNILSSNNYTIPSTLKVENVISVFGFLDFFKIKISLNNFKNYYDNLQDKIKAKYDKLWLTAKLNNYNILLCSLMYELKHDQKPSSEKCKECGQEYIDICNWGCNAHSDKDVGIAFVGKYGCACEICFRCDQSKDHVRLCNAHEHNYQDVDGDAPDDY